MALPTVAIVGRPNVGKSTIFNRIAGERISIVEDIPGITRDRIYTTSEWLNNKFAMIDTGGIEMADTPFMSQIKAQAEIAMDEADVIVFVVDGENGVTDADEYVAQILYKTDTPVILVVNKIDNPERRMEIFDFYSLGLGEPYPVSAVHGIGTGDVLDAIVENLPVDTEEENPDIIKFSLIGRPNVGKSSLINAILGEDRVIASPIAGTTRDAIDTNFTDAEGQEFTMIDTAGMRKRGKVYESTEKYSVMRAMRAIDRSDVVLMVLNAEEGIREYDKRIAGFAHEAGRGIINASPAPGTGSVHAQSRYQCLLSHVITDGTVTRSEEHTSELQSPTNIVCRLLLEKKKKKKIYRRIFLRAKKITRNRGGC